MSTSVSYLTKRLKAVGRFVLLEAAQRGELSYYCAAEAAELVTRRAVLGNGSPNQAKKRAWAVMKAEGRGPRFAPKSGPTPPTPARTDAHPKFSQEPAKQQFSPETRGIIARLVDLGRADLVIAVTERRISPFQAARIAERGGQRRAVVEEKKAERVKTEAKKEAHAPPRIDVRALVG